MPDRALSILQISTLDTRGGAAKVAWNLSQGLKKRGHRLWMAVAVKDSDSPDVFLMPNEHYSRRLTRICIYIQKSLNRYISKVHGVGRLIKILRNMAEPMCYIRDWLGQEVFSYPGTWHLLELLPQRPDIIHCHNLHGGYFDLRALPWLSRSVPTLLTLHDAWLLSGHCAHSFNCERWKSGCGSCPGLNTYPSFTHDATAYNWRRKQRIYSKSKVYLSTPSEWMMRKVDQSILAPSILKKKIIPNGVDLEVFCPGDPKDARKRLGLSLDADIILFVSHVIQENQWRDYNTLENVIRNLSEMPRRKPLLLICLGEKGESRYFRDAETRFVGFQKDPRTIATYYQAADILLHPAKIDNFPLALLESLASGTPVVSTQTGGIPEIVEDNKTGFLVAPGDVRGMALAVNRLLEDRDMLSSFSEKAVGVAKLKFDINIQIETYLSWYKEIIEENKSLKNRGI